MATSSSIFKTVEALTKKACTRDPFEICRQLGIRVVYHDLGKCIRAYYFTQSRIKNIVINVNFSEKFGKLLCAHELGHAILHGKLACSTTFHEIGLFDATTPTEYEANTFAAELLIEDGILSEAIKSGESFFDIAHRLCLPPQLIDFKLRAMNRRGFDIIPPSLFSSDFLREDMEKNI